MLLHLETYGPATVTLLAKAEGMRPQSMGATIAALEAAGLVEGEPDPSDGRQTILALTRTCRDWLKAHRTAGEDWLARTIALRLSASEQLELARCVELLDRLLQEP